MEMGENRIKYSELERIPASKLFDDNCNINEIYEIMTQTMSTAMKKIYKQVRSKSKSYGQFKDRVKAATNGIRYYNSEYADAIEKGLMELMKNELDGLDIKD